MTARRIFVCRDARGSQWQLGPLADAPGRLTLLGWHDAAGGVDAHLPQDVARVLASALTATGRVTFPTSTVASPGSAWVPVGESMVRSLGSGRGIAGRFAAVMRGQSTEIVLLNTQNADVVTTAFDDPAYPWWLQGQVVLVSAPAAAPPELTPELMTALLDGEWIEGAATLSPPGVMHVLRPGVDGDVGGVLSLEREAESVFLAHLEREARNHGFEWAVLTEEAFAFSLAGQPE